MEMNTALNQLTERRIRQTVIPGEPWALDGLVQEICGDDLELRREFSGIVADEYRRRVFAMPRAEMRELYRRCYREQTDANKDWLLGEIVEEIEAQGN